MNQRLLSVGSLLLALMMSAGGYLLVTAFCVDSQPAEMTCHQASRPSVDGRSAMRHGRHTTDFAEAAAAGEQPFETCSHCISHSNLPQSGFVLRQAETSRSSTHVEAPETISNLFHAVLDPRPINAREHAPPGRSSPLHVRINVFRI